MQNSSPSSLRDLVVASFVLFAVVFFVPASSSDRYFEMRFGVDRFINTTTWNILLLMAIGIAVFNLLTRKVSIVEIVCVIGGAALIAYNLVLLWGGSATNYGYIGFLLLTAPAIIGTRWKTLTRAIVAAVFLLFAGSVVTITDAYFGTDISPIVATRFAVVAASSEELSIANASLFGQTNAAGAAIACALLFLLSAIRQGKRTAILVAYLAGFVTLLSTFAFGPILISSFGLLLYATRAKSDERSISLLVFAGLLSALVVINFNIEGYFNYKMASGDVKYERVATFLNQALSDPVLLLLGENFSRVSGSAGFYSESSLVDTWLNFGLAGPLVILTIIAVAASASFRRGDLLGLSLIILIFVLAVSQNSSLMPANVVILLAMLGPLGKHEYQPTSTGVPQMGNGV